MKKNYKYSSFVIQHKKLFFAYLVLDLGLVYWQMAYSGDKYEKVCHLNRINNKNTKLQEVFDWFKNEGFSVYAINNEWMFPYNVQFYKETGMFKYKFDPLIKSILKYSNVYKTSQEVYDLIGFNKIKLKKYEKDLVYNIVINKNFLKYYKKFDTSQHSIEANLYQTSKVPILMIWGTADTWYQMRINANGKLKKSPKIKEIHQHGVSHVARISTLPKAQQIKIWKYIDKILKIKTK